MPQAARAQVAPQHRQQPAAPLVDPPYNYEHAFSVTGQGDKEVWWLCPDAPDDALPEDEAAFYGCEANVVEYTGKSQVIADEIALQYSFFGGDHAQWVEYLNRRDVAPDTWTFLLRHQVRAVSGVSAVPKKTLGRQRKLLMSCVTNYWWCDARRRKNFGLGGGGALLT